MATLVFYFMISMCAMVMESSRHLEMLDTCMSLARVLRTLLTTGCRFICNTSGSGKTRRMLEGLTKYWGFYFVAVPDVNGVGVRDLRDVLGDVAEYREWISDLRPLSSEERAVQSDLNSLIASKFLKKILAARILVSSCS